ncbi:alpha/beta hydrolase [Maritimibacter sp. 55A14]|uniref:alpha/beta fold hydrolase n=1 Tax=Maritimibacter sp. 55A14 TaxID=2174844 RepID=UPI000D60EBB1|nr:alpha/beta fold hydrolase [Maritimibacter sp. 55A14]PWE34379.1 alpha/beta hydrolase [Maritimibacter sp. 55A14]
MEWSDGANVMIEAGGKRLEGACFGPSPEKAPTIALLHEGLGCLALWRDFPARLAAATGFGVFAWSRAGYGRSDPADLPRPLDYMTREAVDVLPEVLSAIGFRRGILMGHSDGATIAAVYAGSVEDFRIRGLILMAPHFFTEPGGLASIAQAKTAYETGDLAARMAKYHDNPDIAFRGWNDAWLDPGFKAWNVAEVIDYLRIPVLAIQGEADEYGTRAQIDELETRSYAPVDVTMLPGCGHAPQIDAPEATLAAAAEFTARLERIEHAEVAVS